jgi:hypothetical protein
VGTVTALLNPVTRDQPLRRPRVDQAEAIMPGVRRLGISGTDTDTSTLAIDMPELGLWLDPPPASEPEPVAPRADAATPNR